MNRVVPDRTITLNLLHRKLNVSLREELGLVRLAWLIGSSPTSHELASVVSVAGLLQPRQTFVDVGANVGLYAVMIASVAQVIGAKVIAIEPMPETAARLRRNLAPYSCASVLEMAMSDCNGDAWMRRGNSSGTARVDEFGAVRVAKRRLDSLPDLQDGRLLIKVDVEGYERRTLNGLSGILPRIDALILDGDEGDPHLHEAVAALGFRVLDGRSMRPFSPGRDFNILGVPQSMDQECLR
jgi:FkbM family methyltransferase